ncbi:MAG: SGNH/GDSL hydrolase family protein, partial [bacterium]|nr:SGNH/GDSL hydrolase family protein [bacterium]
LADHAYSIGFDYSPGPSIETGVAGYRRAIERQRNLRGHEASFVLSEFGGRASGSSDHAFADSLSNAEQTIRFMNAGMDGQLRWNWGRVDSAEFSAHRPLLRGENGEMLPNPSVLYPEAILARYIRSGWDVMQTTLDGARDENGVPRIWATCLRSPDEEQLTLLIVNDGFEAKELALKDMPIDTLNTMHVTGPEPAGIVADGTLQFESGNATIVLKPRSIYALTRLPAGDLGLPERQAIMSRLYKQGLVDTGNTARLQQVLVKARSGEPVTLGVLGGSITGGAGASTWMHSYGPLITEWWENTFPQSRITLVGAGIGGTGSMYGAVRAHEHLLPKQPDFVITEFAVNDDNSRIRQETLEGLTRQILNQSNQPANLLLFMMRNRDGKAGNAQEAQEAIGRHYNLPMLSFRDAVGPEIESGRYRWSDVLADEVHPNDNGHAIGAGLVIQFLQDTLDALPQTDDISIAPAVPEPLFTDTFEHVRLYRAGKAEPLKSEGWTVAKGDWRGPWWESNQPGSVLKLKVEGDTLAIYTNRCEALQGVAEIHIEGERDAKIEGWFPGDILSSGLVFQGLGRGEHIVTITVLDETSPRGGNHALRVYALGTGTSGIKKQ